MKIFDEPFKPGLSVTVIYLLLRRYPDKTTICPDVKTVAGAECKSTPDVVEHFTVVVLRTQRPPFQQEIDVVAKVTFLEIRFDIKHPQSCIKINTGDLPVVMAIEVVI